ncbi:ABC transporter substrate-binding protein [Dactylosporangium siamense]|uniref:Sugar ABC transporter substrate-binding protein n=1 Tax=Dactylosporangium siamense TaxID=685454 RepID=A0A919UCQ3_9ACTN|nr:ABC transporter substrate-binding protein [Dactylosporangium siamense]GIG47051.1 sugar ABC transporter substrate-binding protein [Dactylosporangium siamense]
MALNVDRRRFLIGTLGVAAAGALSACGSPGDDGDTKTGAAADKDVDKLVFLTNADDPTAKPISEKYTKTKVEVRQTDSSTYADNFPRIATASDAPNIAGFFIDGGRFTDLAKGGKLLDLTDVWESSGLNKAVPDLIKKKYLEFTGDGKVYGVPTNTSRYGCLFYRKSVLQAAGVTPPANHVWASEAEWNAACDKLKAAGIEPLSVGGKDGYPLSHLQDGLLSSVMAPDLINSPLKIDYNSPEWKAPVQKLLEWNQKGYFSRGFLGRSTDQGNTLFGQKKVGFSTGMNVWQPLVVKAGTPVEDLDWCLLPPIGALPAKMSIYAGGGVVIPAIAGGHKQAKEFMSYLVSPEAALDGAKIGQAVPARTDVPGLQDALGPIGGSMVEFANQKDRSQFGWDDPAPTDMIEYDRNNLQAVLAGTLTVDAFCAELEKLKAKKR